MHEDTVLAALMIQQTLKAGMPEMTVTLRKAKSAEEVANTIRNAWLTYGVGDITANDDGSQSFSIKNKFDVFDKAMRFLWYKTPDKGTTRTYVLTGSPYAVEASDASGTIKVVVREAAAQGA